MNTSNKPNSKTIGILSNTQIVGSPRKRRETKEGLQVQSHLEFLFYLKKNKFRNQK